MDFLGILSPYSTELFAVAVLFTVIAIFGIGRQFKTRTKVQEKNKPNELLASTQSDQVPTSSQKDLEPPSKNLAVKTRSLRDTLNSSRSLIFGRIGEIFSGSREPSEIESQLEEILYTSDLGPKVVSELMDSYRSELSSDQRQSYSDVSEFLKNKMKLWITEGTGTPIPKPQNSLSPEVWMIVGVNGVGKTTSIGKLAAAQAKLGRKVLVAAGDTFRAAAAEQLKVWSERAQVEIFTSTVSKDPAAVAYHAVEKARSAGFDLVIVDTAGRLHTQNHLMEELKKIKRSLSKLDSSAPHQILLVLDANSGQNALHQAKDFHSVLHLNGVILTKMDGSAKGGVVVGLYREVGIPVRFIGVGEGLDDLKDFSAHDFVAALCDFPASQATGGLQPEHR